MSLQKRNAALSNYIKYGWDLTSNARIKYLHPNTYKILLRKRLRKLDQKGKNIVSKIYKSIIEAENNLLDSRLQYESCNARSTIETWVVSL